MKRCPTCEKTFDDSMRFCQTDGSLLENAADSIAAPSEPLLPAEEPADPYKTVVADAGNIPAPDASGDLLQIPEAADPLKTMYVSEDELRREMAANKPKNDAIFDVPAEPEQPVPEPPAFEEPSLSPPSFGDISPPASPFSADEPPASPYAAFQDGTSSSESETVLAPEAAIPSPFGTSHKEPERPSNPFDQAAYTAPSGGDQAQMEWAPPPAPEAGWQNQPIGQNTPFQPPPASGGLNQTLPIISLVFGIISICCYIGPLTGIVALITGFLGMKNANNNPNQYGGKGLAIAGMIVGGVFFLLSTIYWILIIVGVAMGNLNRF